MDLKRELTREEAIDFFNGGEWKEWDDDKIVEFQLFQDKLCVEFSRFHKAIEKVLCRPVFTHEFAFDDHLKKEYLKMKESKNER